MTGREEKVGRGREGLSEKRHWLLKWKSTELKHITGSHKYQWDLVKKAEATAMNVLANQHAGVLSSHLICLSTSCRQGSISPPICLSSTITKEQERVKKKSCMALDCSKREPSPKEADFGGQLRSLGLRNEALARQGVSPPHFFKNCLLILFELQNSHLV